MNIEEKLKEYLKVPVRDCKDGIISVDSAVDYIAEVVFDLIQPKTTSTDKTPRIDRDCAKCGNTGWYNYDENHSQICPDCCPHDMGYWLLEEHYGKDNGKVCCLRGCGHTKDVPTKTTSTDIEEIRKQFEDEIEGILGDLLGLETQAFTTDAVTQQYVKWDDLFTQLFVTGKQITSLIDQESERAIRKDRESIYKDIKSNYDISADEFFEQYLAERKDETKTRYR